ncbi:hypothetical protein QMP26_30215 [Enterocloster clostridioformis]
MDEKASLSDKKIHMKSTEIHPVSEPKEQEDKKSAVLAANSVSGFRKQRRNSSLMTSRSNFS